MINFWLALVNVFIAGVCLLAFLIQLSRGNYGWAVINFLMLMMNTLLAYAGLLASHIIPL